MNIARGIPKFCPLMMFQQADSPYFRNNTMFIKTLVDLNGLSLPVLQYAVCLNPGIPIHIQQRLIETKLDEYKQLRAAHLTETNRCNYQLSQSSLISMYILLPMGTRQQLNTSQTRSRGESPRDGRDDDSQDLK